MSRHMIEPEEVERLIQAAMPDARVKLVDLTGTRDHYSAEVVSAAFSGLAPLAQHRLVYSALAEPMKGPLHALQLRTSAP
jgi:stress-induced morphogen